MPKVALVSSQKRKNAEHFKESMGYELNYRHPETFNEKLNWLKFNYRDKLMTVCSGKDTVRGYIKQTLGLSSKKYLVRLVGEGVYASVQKNIFDDLPQKFVLKLNNGSGKNIICADKDKLNKEETLNLLNKWLCPESNHYFNFYEWGYKGVVSKIVAEEFLGDWGSVRDYKIFCFNGVPRFIYVSDEFDSDKKTIDMAYLNLNWETAGYTRKTYKPPKNGFEKPRSLKEMVQIARKLSKPFPFVRVDFLRLKIFQKL